MCCICDIGHITQPIFGIRHSPFCQTIKCMSYFSVDMCFWKKSLKIMAMGRKSRQISNCKLHKITINEECMVHRIASEINFLLWFGLAIVIVTNKDTIYVNPSFHADKPKKEKDRTNVVPLFHCCTNRFFPFLFQMEILPRERDLSAHCQTRANKNKSGLKYEDVSLFVYNVSLRHC